MKLNNFNNINKMAKKYNKYKTPITANLSSLDYIDFVALIYNLYTGSFEIVGVNNKGFLRYILTSGNDERYNPALRILNNLKYDKKDFIKAIECD